ncbi:DUF3775 domain-containing protein [Actibacterium lipolyticum]|uniref:DUF3775 domain-containing protein n=1 Tax=Actibacterium lipolyticum TaxID=1524263 RepID=A0A238KU33_9RHOB|nr:DUF3775 domain-containing protein [Actibacterium lipolyticum]SMX46227.1 hypothetical protein COL8621_03014 [Actibacterium lipolyticum]
MLDISPKKVAHVAVRAREIDAKVARWDSPGDVADADTILEARAGDATESELRAFIESLNSDEQASLVAVMWIGRETFGVDDLAEAIQTAKDEADTPTANYLLGIPLLSDYLEAGLNALGHDVSDLEDDFY